MKIKKQKGISSSLGIVIIVIVAIVAVGGALAYRYMWSSDEPIDKMMMRTETPKDETADWQTYRNEEYGFELKYPSKWQFLENSWKNNKSIFPTFSFYELDNVNPNDEVAKVSITKYLSDDYDVLPLNQSTMGVEKITFKDLPALRVEEISEHSLGTYKWIRIYQEDERIEIGLLIYDYNEEKDDTYSPIFDQILSTFKFIE